MQRLERRGLVGRSRSDKDRRSVLISITQDGESLLNHSPSLLQDRFRSALSELQSWEQLQILSTLQRVASLMGAEAIDASPHLTPGEIDGLEIDANADQL
ncbi:transcriptional regulator, MarR family protein [Rhodopirellula europaea 6C]|uniref:Transcriptional regulator, MarR family protein n=1 Tax=Rhodopirellula europaea 6C TaxID=1263867 RepID=M2A901_9BACT|nr:transcriptional regulator, MarR family protein [Rhodopirellula europaea 6C]